MGVKVGAAEYRVLRSAAMFQSLTPGVAHEILAGDAEIDGAGAQFTGDLGGREKGDLDILMAFDATAMLAP